MRILKWIDKNFELLFMCILLFALTAVMFFQIVMRYVFDAALPWPEEFCRACFVTSVWFGASYCVRYRTNLRVDSVLTALPKEVGFWLDLVVDIVTLALYILCFVKSINVVEKSYTTGTIMPSLLIKQWTLYIFIPIGFGLASFRGVQLIIVKLMEHFKKGEEATA